MKSYQLYNEEDSGAQNSRYPPLQTMDAEKAIDPNDLEIEIASYDCYKYWLIVNIVYGVVGTIANLIKDSDKGGVVIGGEVILAIWSIVQFVLIYQGIEQRNSEKLLQGIQILKYYIPAIGLFTLIFAEDLFPGQSLSGATLFVKRIFIAGFYVAFTYYVFMYTALKIVEIFKKLRS